MRDLRVFKGVVLDPEADATTIQVMAGAAEMRDGVDHVPVELRSDSTLHARAVVELAHAPTAADPSREPLPTGSFTASPADAYADGRLFHGPDMHAIANVETCDAAGIIGRSTPPPAPSQWIARPMRSAWLADPIALDAAFQLMILWSHHHRGVPSLPTAVGHYQQFRALPRDGVRIIARITKDTEHAAEATIEFVDDAGRLVAQIERYECVLDASLRDAFKHNQLLEHAAT